MLSRELFQLLEQVFGTLCKCISDTGTDKDGNTEKKGDLISKLVTCL